jgi:serine-type D-Ala-D-Ala carboxypeptidase (penicillin-binding protein 5/6)
MTLTRVSFLIVFTLSVFLHLPAHANSRMIPAAPTLNAKSWLLIDARTGHVITEYNADERLPPASLTKMMTAYIASERLQTGDLKMTDMVPISEKAWRKGGSKMYVRVGTQVKLEDLMRGIIIQSGNDASIAVAEYIAGSEDAFADLMNKTARQLGMTGSHFQNATGWPAEQHYTTARDLATLARHIIYDHPEDYALYAERDFTYNDIRQPNRNTLLWRDASVDGIKTGHTEEAGYCLVSSAKTDDIRLIAVVMGTNSEKERAAESQKLITYGFRFFETAKSYSAQTSLIEPEIWMGNASTIKLGVAEDIFITIPRGASKDVTAELEVPELLEAPITLGQPVGTVKLTLDGKVISTQPLVALEAVDEGGLFTRLWHWLVLLVKGWIS